jgi:hypothetical protein
MCDSVCLRFFFFFLDQLMHAVGGPGAQAVYGIYASTLYCAASLWWTSNMPSDVSPIARQAACPRNSWHSWSENRQRRPPTPQNYKYKLFSPKTRIIRNEKKLFGPAL